MEKEVLVVVSGPLNSGRTTIARLIEHALKENGFTHVSVSDPGDESPNKEALEKRIEATKQRKITIKTVAVVNTPRVANAP